MDERKSKHNLPWDEGIYGTGRTEPKKSHGGIIALLLILVIFLSGIIVFLSLMNVRLLTELSNQPAPAEHAIVFTQRSGGEAQENVMSLDPWNSEGEKTAVVPTLGISGEEVSPFYQHFYELPAGLLITSVEIGSDGALCGMEVGDVLLQAGTCPITNMDSLQAALELAQPGEQVELTIHRDGSRIILILTVSGN